MPGTGTTASGSCLTSPLGGVAYVSGMLIVPPVIFVRPLGWGPGVGCSGMRVCVRERVCA